MAASRRSVEAAKRPIRKPTAAARGTRIEKDLLGERAVPADALYGIHTVRAIENLGFSGRILATLSRLHSRARDGQKGRGTRQSRRARDRRAAPGCDRTRVRRADSRRTSRAVSGRHAGGRRKYRGQHERQRGRRESRQRASRRCSRILSAGASQAYTSTLRNRRPTFATPRSDDGARSMERIAADASKCVAAFRAKAAELRPVITISRTCLQDASRVSLGELFGGHAEVVARRAAEIERSVRSLTQINLGGTAIGSGSGAPASIAARSSGV